MNKFIKYFRTNFPINLMLMACLIPSSVVPRSLPPGLDLESGVVNATNSTNSTEANDNSSESDGDSSEFDNNSPETSDSETEKVETPTETFVFASDLILYAINPGYTINGTRDVGEFIELKKTTDASELSLAGYLLRYTNSSGTSTILYEFSEGSLLVSESLLFRYAKSPDSDQSDATYMTTLALSSGRVELVRDNEVVDYTCWPSKTSDCNTAFKSTKPTTLVRNIETGLFVHESEYAPNFDPLNSALIISPDFVPATPDNPAISDSSNSTDSIDSSVSNSSQSSSKNPSLSEIDNLKSETPKPSPRCTGLEFSELLSYYTTDKSEQYIELYNPTERNIELSGCSIRYKKKTYPLSGEIASNAYKVFYPSTFTPALSLTKNPSSSGTIELIDVDAKVVDTLIYSHGQKKSTSFAKFYDADGEEFWSRTYNPTPGKENIFQEFRSCPEGKTINPDTGNCVKVVTSTTTELAACPAGKYRNPLTGRCKNIETESTPKPCADGYERNPETGRCRKIKTPNEGADYALVPLTESESETHFVAFGIVALLVSVGVIYIILQFRHEIARAFRKIRQRLHDIRKNLISGKIGFHRHK